jgi:formate hydrogenlyase subunit 3/multisubunit Na+/H+ antiporter MnhD subunit
MPWMSSGAACALLSLVGALPVGLVLSIFMTVDVFSHGELLRLASMATGSNGLAVCYGLLAVLTLLSWVAALFVAVGFEEGEANNSCRVVNVLCFLLPASFLLLGVVALNFPVGSLKAGMSSMFVEQEYVHGKHRQK